MTDDAKAPLYTLTITSGGHSGPGGGGGKVVQQLGPFAAYPDYAAVVAERDALKAQIVTATALAEAARALSGVSIPEEPQAVLVPKVLLADLKDRLRRFAALRGIDLGERG
jgi:hypothetical protein